MPVINVNGNMVRFDDDLTDDQISSEIEKNPALFDPGYKAPVSMTDRLKGFARSNLGFDPDNRPKTIAEQAEESDGENAAAPQVKGAPVRQSFYNQALLDQTDFTKKREKPEEGILKRVEDTASQDTKGQGQQRELEGLRTDENVPEGGFVASAKSMAGQTIRGAGRVASDYLGADKDNALMEYGAELIRNDPVAIRSLNDIKDRPFLAFKEASGNMVPSFGAMMGTAIVGQGIISAAPLSGPAAPVVAAVGAAVKWLGPAAIAALPSYSGIRDKQIFNDPKNEEDAKSKAIAALGAAAVGTIEVAFGPQNWAITMLTKEGRVALARKLAATTPAEAFVKGTILGGLQEGGEELAQNPIEQLSSYDNPLTKESLEDTAFGGAMGFLGGAAPGGVTNTLNFMSEQAQSKADRINAERVKLGLSKIESAKTVDEAISAAQEVNSQNVTKDDVLRTEDPNLADIERLTGLKPSEAIDEINAQKETVASNPKSFTIIDKNTGEKLFDTDEKNMVDAIDANRYEAMPTDEYNKRSSQEKSARDTEIVLPDNTSLKAQWDIVDADSVKASLKEGQSQPRDRTRAVSNLQIQSIANNPDYRRLSDSPVMDVGASVLSHDGQIVGGNGRFEALSRAYDQNTAQDYLDNLRRDAVRKGLDPSIIDSMNKPILVRRISEPFDTRKLAIASNSGTSAPYSARENAKIDAERIGDISNLDITDSGDIALTPRNMQIIRDSMKGYTSAEQSSFVDSNGNLSQEGARRFRNAILYNAYGDSDTLTRLIESTDNDMRNVAGALMRVSGDVAKVRQEIKQGAIPKELDITDDLIGAVEKIAQLRSQNIPVQEYLSQQDIFGNGLSDDAKQIVTALHDNIRSQNKIAQFIRDVYDGIGKVNIATGDMLGNQIPSKGEVIQNAKPAKSEQGKVFAKPASNVTTESRKESAANAGNKESGGETAKVRPLFSKNKSSNNTLEDVSENWRKRGIINFMSEHKDQITLSKIIVPKNKRNTGIGTEAMNELISYADKKGKRIVLTPSGDFGGSLSRLKNFYKKFGFVENKGINKDFSTQESMYRNPIESSGEILKSSYNDNAKKSDNNKKQQSTLTKEDIQPLADKYNKKLTYGKIIVLNNIGELPEGTIKLTGITESDKGLVEGAYLGRSKVYIIAQAFDNLNRVDMVIQHELSHLATEELLDSKEYAAAIKSVNLLIEAKNETILNLAAIVKKRQPKLDTETRAKEILAMSVETGKYRNISALRRVVADLVRAFKAMLRRLGVKLSIVEKMSEQEVFATMRNAMDMLYSEKNAKQTGQGESLKSAKEQIPETLNIDGIERSMSDIENEINELIYQTSQTKLTTSSPIISLRSDEIPTLADRRWSDVGNKELQNAYELALSRLKKLKEIYHKRQESIANEYKKKWDLAREQGRTRFVRFGKPPISGKSRNYRDNFNEKGVSVYEMIDLGNGLFEARNNVTLALGLSGGISERDIYVVYGDATNAIGSDGETLVAMKSYKKIDNGNVLTMFGWTNGEPSSSINSSIQEDDGIPETISINGIERPTTNSEGKQIHPTEEGIRNFWKFFGDSKVTDDDGRPLVVYHSTNEDFAVFDKSLLGNFTRANTDSKAANRLAKAGFWFNERSIADQTAQTISMPVYLKIENPYMARSVLGSMWNRADSGKSIIPNGYDGVIVKDDEFGGSKSFVVRESSQIKSATGNTGQFSEKENNILLSKAPQEGESSLDLPEETFARALQRKAQDKFNRFNVIKEFLEKEKGIKLSENADVYRAEERYHSKVTSQIEDFRDKVRNPLIEKIAKADYTLPQVEEYLKNRHAQEANVQIRKLSGNDTDTAYGITDEQAKEYLDKAPKELAKLADEVQAITKATQQLRLDNGLETQERIDAMNGAYKYYVPVRGDFEEQEAMRGSQGPGGRGFDVRYRPKRRLGHSARNEDVIGNIFQDYERAIVQVEKNRVAKSLALMAAEIQMPDLISIDQPVKRKVLRNEKAYGVLVKGELQDIFQTQEAAEQNKRFIVASQKNVTNSDITIAPITDQRLVYSASPMLDDNEVMAYMNGHEIRIQIKDDLLAQAYKNLGVEALPTILRVGRAMNGWMSKAYTGYNPEFIFTNIQRDFTSGLINLTGEEGFLMAMKAVKNYPSSFASLLKYAATGESNKWIDSYRANGGNTGAAYLSDLERLGEEVNGEYAAYQGVLKNLKSGDRANALRAAGRKAFNVSLKYIEHLNQAGENAFRLATFRAMIESGKSANEAAHIAKNVTINFNRKGEIGAELNSLYLFFNANLQGTSALAHALFKGKHKYQAWGLIGGLTSLGYILGAGVGGFDDEDEYDAIGDAVKSRNLIFAAGDGYVKIPVPYGAGFFYNLGRSIAESERKDDVGKLPYQLAAIALEEFSPFNVASSEEAEFNSQKVMYGLMPTALRIPLEPASNFSTFTGREMYPEKEWYKSEPDNEKMWRNTKGTVFDVTAQLLAKAGIEISPETLKYMNRTVTGGTGTFIESTVNAAMLKKEGAELETREIPFVRKAYGELTIQDMRQRYSKAKEEAVTAAEKFNAAMRKNDLVTAKQLMGDKGELIALKNYADKLSDTIKYLRDMQDSIKLSEDYTVAEKRLKIKELEKQEEKFYNQYLDIFKTKKSEMKQRQEK